MREWFPNPLGSHLPFKKLQDWIHMEEKGKVQKLSPKWNIYHANRFKEGFEDICRQYLETVWTKKFPNQFSVRVSPNTTTPSAVSVTPAQQQADEGGSVIA
jgi:hypothetical protein